MNMLHSSKSKSGKKKFNQVGILIVKE